MDGVFGIGGHGRGEDLPLSGDDLAVAETLGLGTILPEHGADVVVIDTEDGVALGELGPGLDVEQPSHGGDDLLVALFVFEGKFLVAADDQEAVACDGVEGLEPATVGDGELADGFEVEAFVRGFGVDEGADEPNDEQHREEADD